MLCNQVIDTGTCPTIVSFLHEHDASIRHLLPDHDKHVSGYLCKKNVDQAKYDKFVNLYPLCPYFELNKPLIVAILEIARGDGSSSDQAELIREILAKIAARNKLDKPSALEQAEVGMKTLKTIIDRKPPTKLSRVRKGTMDAIRKHNKSWFDVFFNSSDAIEIETTKRLRRPVATKAKQSEVTT